MVSKNSGMIYTHAPMTPQNYPQPALLASHGRYEAIEEGPDVDGPPMRWIFSDITPNRFCWRGQTWDMEQEMFATRRTN